MAEIIRQSPTRIKRQCFWCSNNGDLFASGEYPQISAIATQIACPALLAPCEIRMSKKAKSGNLNVKGKL